MSAFLCQPRTIALAATALNLQNPYALEKADLDEAISQLAQLNIKGYQARYGADRDDIRGDVKKFREAIMLQRSSMRASSGENEDPLVAYKQLRCVLYQAYEGAVPNSALFKDWDKISTALAHRIAAEACDAAGVEWDG